MKKIKAPKKTPTNKPMKSEPAKKVEAPKKRNDTVAAYRAPFTIGVRG